MRLRGAVSHERKHLAWLKGTRTHSPACAVKAFGGGPAAWTESDKRRCTCFLGKQIAESRARLAEMRPSHRTAGGR